VGLTGFEPVASTM